MEPRSIRLFNRTLHSHLLLRPNFLPGGMDADLTVSLNGEDSEYAGSSTQHLPEENLIEFNFSKPSRIDFKLYPDTILCSPYTANSIEIEIAFLGQVMAVWMESRGALMFHAGAVRQGRGCRAHSPAR